MFRNIAKWIVITGTLALIAVATLPGLDVPASRNTVVEIPSDLADQILSASVQIMILHPQGSMQFAAADTDGTAYVNSRARVRINAYDADLGLGTLVSVEGEAWVLTHNHWHPLTAEARVRFSDAAGNLLVEMDSGSFESLIRYQDPGTLLLQAPAGLSQVRAAGIGNADAAVEGKVVHIVRRSPDDDYRLEVLAAEVQQMDTVEDSPVYRLQAQDGQAIVRGDSGGGVWIDGYLVANNWKTQVNRTLGWNSLRTFSFIEQPTAQSTAAQVPAGLFDQPLNQTASLAE